MRGAVLIVIAGSLIFGCSQKTEKERAEKAPEKVISAAEAVSSLPCFKCHSYQKFSSAPQKGIFSHQIHTKTGYHCNQCHDFEGHKYMKINKDLCGNCHNIKVIALKKTSMPSKFNHESHSKMFGCKECHPKTFVMKAGAAHITMKDINEGKFCGACHNGKAASPASDCEKCHKG